MDRQELRKTLVELLEDTTGETYPEVDESQSLTDGLGLDSVDLFSLVVETQSRFQIKIASEDLVKVATVGDLLEHYPRRWTARGDLTSFDGLHEAEHVTVHAEVVSATSRRMRSARGSLRAAAMSKAAPAASAATGSVIIRRADNCSSVTRCPKGDAAKAMADQTSAGSTFSSRRSRATETSLPMRSATCFACRAE